MLLCLFLTLILHVFESNLFSVSLPVVAGGSALIFIASVTPVLSSTSLGLLGLGKFQIINPIIFTDFFIANYFIVYISQVLLVLGGICWLRNN